MLIFKIALSIYSFKALQSLLQDSMLWFLKLLFLHFIGITYYNYFWRLYYIPIISSIIYYYSLCSRCVGIIIIRLAVQHAVLQIGCWDHGWVGTATFIKWIIVKSYFTLEKIRKLNYLIHLIRSDHIKYT